MLSRVAAIALNTYREALRARILLGLAGVAFAVAFYSIVVGTYTLRNAARVVSDLGAASASVFAIAVAIIIGATSLHRELEQKTLFPILARPIRRGEYLVGKYLGTLLTIAVFVMADAGLVLLISAGLGGRSLVELALVGVALVVGLALWMWRSTWARTFGPIPWSMLVLVAGVALCSVAPEERRVVLAGGVLALLEVSIVSAIGLLFSSFSTPFLSALLTFGVLLIGRNADMLAQLPVKYFGEGIANAGKLLAKIVPNLHVYVPPRPLLTGEIVGQPLDAYMALAAAAALAWSVGLLATASFVFRKRDFL
jgi:ABC-type transport system involved in multi-copper enzyme maturation permease subunit